MSKKLPPAPMFEAKFPRIVLADHNYGYVAFMIKRRTKGNYSHVMYEIAPGIMASQTFGGYKKVKVQDYMLPGNRLKYLAIEGITDEGRDALMASINKKLNGPWYRKLYDYLGIVGQATGLTWIHTPGMDFCSEDVPSHLLKAYYAYEKGFPPPLDGIIQSIPPHISPQGFDQFQKRFKQFFPLLGYWNSDE